MKTRTIRWFVLSLILPLGLLTILLIVPGGGLAQQGDEGVSAPGLEPDGASDLVPEEPVPASLGELSLAAAPLDVGESTIATDYCYDDGTTQTLCFSVNNGSTDNEWLDEVRLTFPNYGGLGAWNVSCKTQDPTDSTGYSVNLTCSTPFANEVRYDDLDGESPDPYGEISAGASWGFCVDATVPSGYIGPRIINWGLSGDETALTVPPHEITGTLEIEHCTPLMIKPETVVVEGCNGLTQTLTFELWDYSAGSGTFSLTYPVPTGNGVLIGPSDFYLNSGEIVTFTTQLVPDQCNLVGQPLHALVEAQGNGEFDSALIEHTTSLLAGWQVQPSSSPTATMDNVVVWASVADGGLWSIGGYGSDGATQRYDPGSGTWTTHKPESVITPLIEYPMDGCYGTRGTDEIVVLFPDTIVTGSLHIYNISTSHWFTEPVPGWFPPEGRWGLDVVSLRNTPGVHPALDANMCYLSGGSTQTGGGRTRDLWRYDPEDSSGGYVGHFPADIWFGFHASWYVPWIGNYGSICIAGGADHNHQITNGSQCYDLEYLPNDPNGFRPLNVDLGPLPEPWWGMADGWQIYHGRYQIWLANGVAQDGTLLPISAYADSTTGGFVQGPDLPVPLYRVEGDGFEQGFYLLGGSQGGFWYSSHNQLLVRCPWCSETYLPATVRDYP